jgi:GntR family transcriptional regulator of abcA and norABC
MTYGWKPDRSVLAPLHAQVSEYFRSLINTGALSSGERIPSQRQLIKLFDISRTTAITAFEQLLNEGLIISHPRSGFVVAPSRHAEGSSPDWSAYIRRAKHRPGREDYKRWFDLGSLAEFAVGDEFDLNGILAALYKNFNFPEKNADDFRKYGYQPLREALALHLRRAGISTLPYNILICPSVTAGASLIYSAFAGTGSNFLYEKPNLVNTVSDIHSIGLNMIDIGVDEYGLSSRELAKVAAKISYPFLHIDPSDQCPTGTTMSKRRRGEIMNIVRTYKLPVVEIDHLRDVWGVKPFPPPLKSMEGGQNVIYLSSVARTFPIDMRIGWIVADRKVIEHLGNVAVQMNIRPSMVLQIMAYELFRTGLYDKFMEKLRLFVRERREAALRVCEKYLTGIAEWKESNCWFHFWLNFPGHNTKKIFSKGDFMNCYPGYFFDRTDTSHILFCPSFIKEKEIGETITKLASKCRREEF